VASTAATRPRIVTSTRSSGSRDTKAKEARLEGSTPPLPSSYFFTTPKTNAVGVTRRCVASTDQTARSTGFIAPASLVPPIRLPSGKARKQRSEGRVVPGRGRLGVIALGHGRR